MPSCCAYGCSNRSSRKTTAQKEKEQEKSITFHKFPKNPERRAEWIQAIRRVDWNPTNTSIVCSAHFTDDCFNRTSSAIVRLRDSAVPSIFNPCPTNLPKSIKRPQKKIGTVTTIAVDKNSNPTNNLSTSQIEDVFVKCEFPSTSLETPTNKIPTTQVRNKRKCKPPRKRVDRVSPITVTPVIPNMAGPTSAEVVITYDVPSSSSAIDFPEELSSPPSSKRSRKLMSPLQRMHHELGNLPAKVFEEHYSFFVNMFTSLAANRALQEVSKS